MEDTSEISVTVFQGENWKNKKQVTKVNIDINHLHVI